MGQAGPATDAEVIKQQLERILASRVFFLSQRSRAFLRYVVEKAILGHVPKEYEIAVGVFERSPDYDPTVDATVRVEASRLRSRLREYYTAEGQQDPVLIDIPKGGYACVFTLCERHADDGAGWSHGEAAKPAQAASPALEGSGKRGRIAGMGRGTLWAVTLGCSLATAALAAWNLMRWERAREPIRSLAVLPLQNLSGDLGQNYFAAGMTDELTTELARIHGLRVVSRTSAVAASRSQSSLPQIAAALKVDAVVEGSVSRSGNEIRITAQLIDARSDKHLWARSFEGQATNILSLQDTVADEIAAQAQVALQAAPATGQATQSIAPDAHDAYFRGLYFFEKQDFERSIESFRKAISLDPNYAAAYAELATALDAQTTFQSARPGADMDEALKDAKRAIELDPENGVAYTELGSIQTIYTWDWPAAERNLLRGIALSPSSSIGEMKYAVYLDAVGRPDEAVEHERRALDLDPMSFFMTRRLGVTLFLARHYRQALYELHEAAEMEPDRADSFDNWVSAVLEMQGKQAEAVLEDLTELHFVRPSVDTKALASIFSREGWKAYWRARINAEHPYANDQCESYEMAMSEVRIGDLNRAFPLFNQAVDQRCYALLYLKTDPGLDPIRTDARFGALLKRVNLEQ
ncbi:MAG TPA: tetratricopeptide repeat protein [Terracidiphilus sp.]|nr:tetratricopeptide repeat protein [Terracidiphilus sp.]